MFHKSNRDIKTRIKHIFSVDYIISKRQLGIVLLLVGIIGFIGIFALDYMGGGREVGIGPTQRAALIVMVVVVLFGASLIPLGDTPA